MQMVVRCEAAGAMAGRLASMTQSPARMSSGKPMLSRLRLGANTVARPTVKFTANDTASTGSARATAALNKVPPSSANATQELSGATPMPCAKLWAMAANIHTGPPAAMKPSNPAQTMNLNATTQNLTTALGVVQDANIPAVSNQLTEAQIQAQSGVAALKSSTQLQQSYLSLLP